MLAGASVADALIATLGYRLASYWLTLPAGFVAYALFRQRYGPVQLMDPKETQPKPGSRTDHTRE